MLLELREYTGVILIADGKHAFIFLTKERR
jgi:hypothetical protein